MIAYVLLVAKKMTTKLLSIQMIAYIHLIATKKNYLKNAWAHIRINEKKHFLKSSASAQQEGGREGAPNFDSDISKCIS